MNANARIGAIRQRVHAAPYPAAIRFSVATLEFDACRIDLDLDERHLQPFGSVHGSVLATLIDTATFRALGVPKVRHD